MSVVGRDGSIQSNLVWPDFDGTYIKLNMLRGSPKERNIARQRRATILVWDRNDEALYATIRCRLHRVTTDVDRQHLNMITQRNMDASRWYGEVEPSNPEEEARRVIVWFLPVRGYFTESAPSSLVQNG